MFYLVAEMATTEAATYAVAAAPKEAWALYISYALAASFVVRVYRFVKSKTLAADDVIICLLNLMLGVLFCTPMYTGEHTIQNISPLGLPVCAVLTAVLDQGFCLIQDLIKMRIGKQRTK